MKEPHNFESEKTVLGSIISSPTIRNELVNGLVEEDFYSAEPSKPSANALIFRAMNKIISEGGVFDIPSLINELDINMKVLDKVGGTNYIKDLIECYIGDRNAVYHRGVVKETSLSRKLIACLNSCIEGFEKEKFTDVGLYVAQCEEEILNITRERESKEFRNANDIVQEITEDIKISKEKGGKDYQGIDTGYTLLNQYTQGWQPGQLNILAARPSVGKTAFALNLAYNTAINSGKTVAFFSLEMDAKSIVRRILSLSSSVNQTFILNGKLQDSELIQLDQAITALRKTRLLIDDTAGENLANIKTKAQKLKATHKDLCCIFIDYLGLITTTGKRFDSRQNEVAEISRQLKALARELEVPIICLSQLSRESEKRSGAERMPKLSDLRDSGSIEQDADIVMFIHREKYQNAEAEKEANPEDKDINNRNPFANAQETKINVAKNRNGRVGVINYTFFMNIGKFAETDTREGNN